MKKTILISVGVLSIFAIVGVWLYLFLYGAPENGGDIFARFGSEGDENADVVVMGEGTVDVGNEDSASAPQKLRQLTTRPVAGAGFTESGILYIEEGTGHLYHIDLGTGEETLLSGTTLPGARDASFSPDSSYLSVTTLRNGVSETFIGFADSLNGNLDGVLLPAGAREVAFSSATSTVFYLLPSETGSSGYSYDIETEESTELFRIPLTDVRVLWGDGATYVYTTPSGMERGYVYRISGNALAYVSPGGVGLGAFLYNRGIVVTAVSGTGVASRVYTSTGTTSTVALPLIPEKCAGGREMGSVFYCGVPSEIKMAGFPDEWYMGIRSYNDTLWGVNAETGELFLLSDFLAETGREIDILKIGTDEYGNRLYFINKNDNALWMFDTTL